MADGDGELDFYPAFCFRESPTHFTWVKMAAIDVHRLQRRQGFAQGIFFYLNHPIRFVCVVGLIVARTDVYKRTILTLDDSSGATIDIAVLEGVSQPDQSQSQSQDQDPDQDQGQGQETQKEEGKHVTATTHEPLDITALTPGTVVKIKGTVSTFRDTLQLCLERMFPIADTNAEMRFLDERTRVLVEVLSVPWELSHDEVSELRRRELAQETQVAEEHALVRRRLRRRVEREERDQRRIRRLWEREEREREREALSCRDAGRRVMLGLGRVPLG